MSSSDAREIESRRQELEATGLRGDSPSLGKKRPLEETPTFSKFRLEAIFHPKFENENQNDKLVRAKMKLKIQAKEGYLEVTLKHSGSLLLWSGGQRFYSKNSTDNVFSLCGEVLLGQHFRRVQGDFATCSEYVQANRLTLSFEVVTSFLGDHGERPKRDFLILTAVADRNAERFYSTSEIIEFAQRFRLPHNDAFVFATPESVDQLFRFYDESREVGTATPVIHTLTQYADYSVKSLYPHPVFQGEIIEGFVVRYVPSNDKSSPEKMESLAKQSEELLKKIPPDRSDGWAIEPTNGSTPKVLATNLRELAKNSNFESKLRTLLDSSRPHRSVKRVSKSELPDMLAVAETLQNTEDIETKRIVKLLQTIKDINAQVDFSVMNEMIPTERGTIFRWLCIIHIIHDFSFQKFHKSMSAGDMPLFRGFSISLMKSDDPEDPLNTGAHKMEIDSHERGESLMLKLKFLPYMVRTFGCRNGLHFVEKGGVGAFTRYTLEQMTKWKISNPSKHFWQKYFKAWAAFIRPRLDKAKNIGSEYLTYLNEFNELYEKGLVDTLEEKKSEFSGIIFVVAPDDTVASRISLELASKLGAKVLEGRRVEENTLLDCQMEGGGVVFKADLANLGIVKSLTKKYQDFLAVVRCNCDENALEASLLPEKEKKKSVGLIRGWNGLSLLCSDIRVAPEDDLSSTLGQLDLFIHELKKRQSPVEQAASSSPGLLLYFPVIPGSGKSSLLECSSQEIKNSLSQNGKRNFIVKEGDKTPGKYWKVVMAERMKDTSAVYVTDKNAPVVSIDAVVDVCAKTKAFGIAVLPDKQAVCTTEVTGARYPDGTIDNSRTHFYPFSLKYLALCMTRVLDRAPGSHSGKLDCAQAQRASLVVVKFFALYRRISADVFISTLDSKFEEGGALTMSPIEVPFFSSSDDLHPEVESILLEALQAQFGYDFKRVDTDRADDKYLDDLECRLRATLTKHKSELLSMTVPLERSAREFASRVRERVAEADTVHSYEASERPSFIKLAAVDVEPESLYSILLKERANPALKDFFEQLQWDEAMSMNSRFVERTHVTIDHWSRISQSEMREKYSVFVDKEIPIEINGVLWSENVAALSVQLTECTTDGAKSPQPSNEFVHITLWLREGFVAKESNDLPELCDKGEAKRYILNTPYRVTGKISLWDD